MIVGCHGQIQCGCVRQDKRASYRGYPFVCTSLFSEADGVPEAVFCNLLIFLCRFGGCYEGVMCGDDFEPRLGKIRNRTPKSGKRYAHQVLVAINLAGGQQRVGAALP